MRTDRDREELRITSERAFSPASIATAYGEALRAGRGGEAERIALAYLRDGNSVAAVYEEVLAPAMVEIGTMWSLGEMTIADEHLASALNLKVMSAIYVDALPSRPERSLGRVLLAGIEGDSHEVGIRMAGDVIDLAGFELKYLGADVGIEPLLDSISNSLPGAVVLGLPSEMATPATEATISALRRCFPQMPILLGGRGVTCGSAVDLEVVSLGTLAARLEAIPLRPPGSEPTRRSAARRSLAEAMPAVAPTAEDRMLEVAADTAEAARAYARAGQEFRRLAFEDPLTGVANRRALEDRIEEHVRSGRTAVLLVVDLDRFKEVNDGRGHLVGDHVLREVASILQSVTLESDFVARMGGDEFAVLIPGEDIEVGRAVALDFSRRLEEAPGAEGVTATCGISRLEGDRRAALMEADLALYRGKSLGGNTVA